MKWTEDVRYETRNGYGNITNSYVAKDQFSVGNAIGSASGLLITIAVFIFFSIAALLVTPLWFIVNQNLYRLNKINAIYDTTQSNFVNLKENLNISKTFSGFKKSIKIKTYLFNTFYLLFFLISIFAFTSISAGEWWVNALLGGLFSIQVFFLIYFLFLSNKDKQINTLFKELRIKEKKWINTVMKLLLVIYMSTIPLTVNYAIQNNVVQSFTAKVIYTIHSNSKFHPAEKENHIYSLYDMGLISSDNIFKASSSKYAADTRLLDYLFMLYKEKKNIDSYFSNNEDKILENKFEMILASSSRIRDFNESSKSIINSKSKYRFLRQLRNKYKDNLTSFDLYDDAYSMQNLNITFYDIKYFRMDDLEKMAFPLSILSSTGLLLLMLVFYKKTLQESYIKNKIDSNDVKLI